MVLNGYPTFTGLLKEKAHEIVLCKSKVTVESLNLIHLELFNVSPSRNTNEIEMVPVTQPHFSQHVFLVGPYQKSYNCVMTIVVGTHKTRAF